MPERFASPVEPFEGNEVTWATGRLPDRIYAHRSFTLDLRASQDFGQPARYVVKVFDEPAPDPATAELDREEWIVTTTPAGRKQLKLQVAREAGHVRELVIERVPTSPHATRLEPILRLDRDGAARLIDLVKLLDFIPVEGATSVHVDEQMLRDLFADPSALRSLYRRDPERFRRFIESDEAADDVIAVAHRRDVVERYRRLLSDPGYFAEEAAAHRGGREAVWQDLLEDNPWILGASLAGQLLTSWDDDKLEQVVAGFSVGGSGKRVDALMRTNGRIRGMAFAEIKHHETALVSTEYRSGCWAPSPELVGGVTQVQQTVHRATREIGGRLADTDEAGAETGEYTYLVRPRSYLITGNLAQLRGPSGVHRAKYESFELYRRNLYEPEIITFDELLARAEWHVTLLDGEF
jgi:hypothetical protein